MTVSSREVSTVEGSVKMLSISRTGTLQNEKSLTISRPGESLCWSEAKIRFRTKISQTNPRPSEENIERFLKNNNQIDETISECENLKTAANRQYHGSTSSRFIGKLLEVLVVVKNVGDPLLQCAPESVSIAWSAISLLIGLGVNDIENCGRISEACTSIVTIVLNCRLYENRYQDEEANSKIIESVQELLSTVLDFFWLANKKLRDKKIKRLFKDIFDSKVNETYQDVITRYKALREDTDLAFQERVMESLLDMKKEKADIIELLFPALKDITTNLEDLVGVTKGVLSEIQVRDKFKRYKRKLKPTDTHFRQLTATLQPFKHGTTHLCQWLFRHQHYQTWERVLAKNRLKRDEGLMTSFIGTYDRLPSLVFSESAPEIPSTNLLYIKGRAGFGKSVMMASVIKKLQQDSVNNTEPTSIQAGTSGATKGTTEKHPVLYFFFKRGDDATQLTSRGFSSLVTQLFDEDHAKTKEEMEAFINAIDSVQTNPSTNTPGQPSEKTSGTTGESDAGPRSNQKISLTTSNQELLQVESIAAAAKKTVYIVIDGIDECTDHESEGLVKELINLSRSKKASFKILISSREDMGFEQKFVKEDDQEGRKKLELATTINGPGLDLDTQDPFHCLTHDDFTILTVTKETNSEDMRTYLNNSLQTIMKRRLPEVSRLNRKDPRQRKLDARIKNIAESIQKKSDGMFTYSAMVIANIGQPSPLSLTERLRNLPSGMNELYSRQLEALTGAERKLVTLALKRIVWSPTDMGTVELAEEFKQIYLKETEPEKEDNVDDYDGGSIDGSESEEEYTVINHADSEDFGTDEVPNGSPQATRPPLHRSNTYPGENPIEKAMRNPEIADTIYHLEGAGRDFFKFTNKKRTIGFIHKSVRDWFESESAKAAQRDYGIKSVASLFSHDTESGELKLTLPIPWIVVKGQSESMEFQSEKDAQLDILIYILRVLTHPRFQETYMPYHKLLKALEKKEAKKLKKARTSAVRETDTPKQIIIIREAPDGNLESVGTDVQQLSNPEIPLGDLISDEPSTKAQETAEDEVIDNSGTDEEGEEVTQSLLRDGPQRCEVHQWIHHMRQVGKLWPREERNGKKWTELKDLLRKFSDGEFFRPWFVQNYHPNYEADCTAEFMCQMALGMEIIHLAAFEGLEVYVEFLINETDVDLGKLSVSGRSALNYQDILYFPETVKLVLEKNIDINIKDTDGVSPLTLCLDCRELNQDVIDGDSERVKNLIQTLKYLINHGADLNNPLPSGLYPVHCIIEIDESLFDLAIEKDPTICRIYSKGRQRTALHTIWASTIQNSTKVSIARKLLEAGADPNAQDSDSRAPLYEAAFSGNREGVELLLEEKYNVDINDEDVNGRTALIALASYDLDDTVALDLVKLLLEHNADIKPRAKNGWTALLCALWYEHWEIAEVLMEAHAKEQGDDHSYLTQKDINDETILHIAATDPRSGLKIAKIVLEKLTAEEKSDFLEVLEPTKGRAALQRSLTKRQLDFALYMIENGANCHAIDSSGESVGDTFLNIWLYSRKCSSYDLYDSWEIWTKLYCTILPNDPENAYLHQAIFSKSMGIILRLAEAGIDPLKKDSEGWDAFDWAYCCDQVEVLQECFPNIEVDYQLRKAESRDKFARVTGWNAEQSQPPLKFSEVDNIFGLDKNFKDTYEEKESDVCDRDMCPCPYETRYSALANHPIAPYVDSFYYEVTILEAEDEKNTNIIVGLVGEGAPMFELPGWDHKNVASYGFHGDDGQVYAPSWAVGDNTGRPLETGPSPVNVGDTIGCGYDNIDHTIFWTLNGRFLGFYRGLRVYGRLYPCVGGRFHCSISANFGNDPSKPFKWNGERVVCEV
ncbi:hypothetical protein TWF106_005467 [Orbilia oligospora]|uniref:B30.2/SPRY domain-containing protein n=1 Tax=Orbilia oligospora TaxID=2813651 RepID=A0A7C8V4N6_ORBOL|nr:hypothetical protein TWF106_005467 [Orbilia oligospora]